MFEAHSAPSIRVISLRVRGMRTHKIIKYLKKRRKKKRQRQPNERLSFFFVFFFVFSSRHSRCLHYPLQCVCVCLTGDEARIWKGVCVCVSYTFFFVERSYMAIPLRHGARKKINGRQIKSILIFIRSMHVVVFFHSIYRQFFYFYSHYTLSVLLKYH